MVQGVESTMSGKAWVVNLFAVYGSRDVTFSQILVDKKAEVLGWTQVQAMAISPHPYNPKLCV